MFEYFVYPPEFVKPVTYYGNNFRNKLHGFGITRHLISLEEFRTVLYKTSKF